MASLTAIICKHATLVANTVDTVTFSRGGRTAAVTNRATSGILYFTIDGTTPAVAADDTYMCPAGVTKVIEGHGTITVVKLKSATADAYSVECI